MPSVKLQQRLQPDCGRKMQPECDRLMALLCAATATRTARTVTKRMAMGTKRRSMAGTAGSTPTSITMVSADSKVLCCCAMHAEI
jgi:hypothetical protein